MVDYDKIRKIADDFYVQVNGMIGIYRGKCMFPTLKEGWKVKLRPVAPEDIKLGEIVVFGKKKRFICHRIIGRLKINGKIYFFHRGDNSAAAIGVVPADLIVGKATEVSDTNSTKVDNRLWENPNGSFIICNLTSYFIYFIYKILSYIKKALLGRRKTKITDTLRIFYWELSSLLLRHISKNTTIQKQ